jgi:hypothetical protein
MARIILQICCKQSSQGVEKKASFVRSVGFIYSVDKGELCGAKSGLV